MRGVVRNIYIFFNFIFLKIVLVFLLESENRRRLLTVICSNLPKGQRFHVLYRNVFSAILSHSQITHYSELTDWEKLIAKYSVSSIHYVYLGKYFKFESNMNYNRTSILSNIKHSKQIIPATATRRCLRANISI